MSKATSFYKIPLRNDTNFSIVEMLAAIANELYAMNSSKTDHAFFMQIPSGSSRVFMIPEDPDHQYEIKRIKNPGADKQ